MIVALCSALALASVPTAALAENGASREAGIGVASAFGSLLYAPCKMAYALGGTLVGGLAWVFSAGDTDVAAPIWNRAVRGDYVLTPEHVRRERPIEFIGRDNEVSVAAGPPDPAYPPPANDPAW
ncbi:MAG: hypothetical protein JRH16_03085 [Deltaproteobacteria bacterium]|nr:hypothetical protein [Deltaproteobacteria bacterium]MBW2360296.1 hypothetical protein [Deltaproteobacteria bacterium]